MKNAGKSESRDGAGSRRAARPRPGDDGVSDTSTSEDEVIQVAFEVGDEVELTKEIQ